VGSVGWVSELEGESVALVSKAVELTAVSVVGESVDVVKGSYTNVQLDRCAEVVVVFRPWLVVASSGAEDSTACGCADTVVYVVEVIVTVVPMCWLPKVQKTVGGPPSWGLYIVEDALSLSALSDSMGWYWNGTALVAMAFDALLTMRADVLGATGIEGGGFDACEDGNIVTPLLDASDSEGLPAYGW
jgi:hypothetical protein